VDPVPLPVVRAPRAAAAAAVGLLRFSGLFSAGRYCAAGAAQPRAINFRFARWKGRPSAHHCPTGGSNRVRSPAPSGFTHAARARHARPAPSGFTYGAARRAGATAIISFRKR